MDAKKKAAVVVATTVAAAGMATGALFDTPADLMGTPEPDAVVETLADEDGESVTEERKTPASRLRNWMLSLPEAVRMLVCVPLWCIGWVLLSAMSVLWGGAAPILNRLVSWLCLSLVLLAVFAVGVKAALPNVPLRTILRPRNLLLILLATLLLGLADLALPSVWNGYDAATQLVWRIGATCLLGFLCITTLHSHGGQTAETAPVQKNVPERTEVELQARALADSVTPRYWE